MRSRSLGREIFRKGNPTRKKSGRRPTELRLSAGSGNSIPQWDGLKLVAGLCSDDTEVNTWSTTWIPHEIDC